MRCSKKTTTLLILCFGLLLYSLLVIQYSRRFNFNMYGFSCIGEYFKAPFLPENETFIFKKSYGYDGQFFLFAAYDPLIRGNVRNYMDVPHYRYQRMLYPLLINLFSLGKPEVFPYAMVALNVFFILIGVYVLTKFLDFYNLHLSYSLFYVFLSGLCLSLFRNLGEPLNILCVLLSFYFFVKRKYAGFALALSFSFLSKETSLLLCPAFFIGSIRERQLKMLVPLLFSVLVFFLWQYYIFLKCGVLPFRGGTSNFDYPLKAMLKYAFEVINRDGDISLKFFAVPYVLMTLFTFFLAFREILRSVTIFSLAFLTYSIFFAFMSSKVWVEPWSFARVFLPLNLISILCFFRSRSKFYLVPLYGHAILFPVILLWVRIL